MGETMKAGRELDALIAEKVMGWKPYGRRTSGTWTAPEGYNASAGKWPNYSSDIAAAWEVVDKLMADAFQVTVTVSHESGCCCFVRMGFTDAAEFEVSDAPTVPLAICRAALAAVSAPEPTTEGSEPA